MIVVLGLVSVFVANSYFSGVEQRQERIVRGRQVEGRNFPFIAAIGQVRDGRTRFFCSGAAIDERHVLTAAHCLHDEAGARVDPGDLTVVVGQANLAEFRRSEAARVLHAEVHPDYDAQEITADLALLTLDRRVSLRRTPDTASMLVKIDGQVPKVGTLLEVAGFGITAENHNLLQRRATDGSLVQAGATHLRSARIPMVNSNRCQAALDRYGPSEGLEGLRIGNGQLCAGNEAKSGDACRGDSGGPLIMRGISDAPVLVGIVSYGIGCGRNGVFGVYTRVGKYADWLDAEIARQ